MKTQQGNCEESRALLGISGHVLLDKSHECFLIQEPNKGPGYACLACQTVKKSVPRHPDIELSSYVWPKFACLCFVTIYKPLKHLVACVLTIF